MALACRGRACRQGVSLLVITDVEDGVDFAMNRMECYRTHQPKTAPRECNFTVLDATIISAPTNTNTNYHTNISQLDFMNPHAVPAVANATIAQRGTCTCVALVHDLHCLRGKNNWMLSRLTPIHFISLPHSVATVFNTSVVMSSRSVQVGAESP